MSRKPPSDAFTRFTSTAPSSSSTSSANSRFSPNAIKPNSQTPSSPSPSPSSSNPNETPAERVARLRATHRANQLANAQLSPVDKLIARGRNFADIAHRLTTYSLLAITGVSTVIAAYGIVSLVSHNRRQKRAWIERELDRLAEAQRAFLRGDASAEQLHLLEQERAGEELARRYAEDKKRRKEEGVWPRLKGTFGGFLGGGDMGVESVDRQKQVRDLNQQIATTTTQTSSVMDGTTELRQVAVQTGPVAGVGLDEKGRPIPINKVERVIPDRSSPSSSSIPHSGPGQLDILAANTTAKVQSAGQGWWSWVTGGSRASSSPSPSTSTST